MPNPQNQKLEDLPWHEQINIVRTLALFPAITVMVFIRRKIGFRLMNSTWLIILTIIMLAISSLPLPSGPIHFGPIWRIYAVLMLVLGTFQRWRRWGELCRGERWHTYSPGISILEALPLPWFLKSNRRVNRFLDPSFVAIVGVIVGQLTFDALGLWIMLSAVCLYVYEQNLYEKQLARDLDILDGMVSAEVQEETVKLFEGKSPDLQHLTLQQTAGIPTGLAPDIHKQIQMRRKRTPPPDNLAPETPGSRT